MRNMDARTRRTQDAQPAPGAPAAALPPWWPAGACAWPGGGRGRRANRQPGPGLSGAAALVNSEYQPTTNVQPRRGAFKKKEKENSHEKSNPGKKRPTDFSFPFSFFFSFFSSNRQCAVRAGCGYNTAPGNRQYQQSALSACVLRPSSFSYQ